MENNFNAQNITIPEVYAPLFQMNTTEMVDEEGHALKRDNKNNFVLASGRISGKTTCLVALWWVYINYYPDNDIVVLQATTTEIKDSIINEIEKFLKNSDLNVGDNPNATYYIPKAHDRIVIQDGKHKGVTYFKPITDSQGGQRARGIATTNPISLVLFEEAQKNLNANVVRQAYFTFVRQLMPNAKVVIVGNSETQGHWFIDFVEEQRKKGWTYIYANCYHIWNLLNETTKQEIEDFKKANYLEFRRVFLGDIRAATSDVVFPQFERAKHYKKATELGNHFMRWLFIGVDHATANDTFAIVPVAILEDGTCQTLEVCYDDPEQTQRTLAPTEQCDLLEDFLIFLDNKYGLAYNQVKTIISIDGAASPFIRQVIHQKNTSKNREMWRKIEVKGFTRKKKEINMGIIKNAFAYGVLTILNEGSYQWDHTINRHRLAHEIEAQRYKNGKLDPAIKNDLCDALEYGLIPYYTNCYNLSFPTRNKNSKYDEIRKLGGIK